MVTSVERGWRVHDLHPGHLVRKFPILASLHSCWVIGCWTFLTKSSQALIFVSHVPRLCKLPKWFPQGFPSGSLIPLSIPYQFLAFLESSSPKLCFLSGLFTTSFPALLSWRVPLWSFDFCNSYVSLGTSNTILPCFDFLKELINPPMPTFDLLQDSSRNPKE